MRLSAFLQVQVINENETKVSIFTEDHLWCSLSMNIYNYRGLYKSESVIHVYLQV